MSEHDSIAVTDSFFNLVHLHSDLLEFLLDAHEREDNVFAPYIPALTGIACEQALYIDLMMQNAREEPEAIPHSEVKMDVEKPESLVACFHESPTCEHTLKFSTLNTRLIECICAIVYDDIKPGPMFISLLETAYFQAEFVMANVGSLLALTKEEQDRKLRTEMPEMDEKLKALEGISADQEAPDT